ncbi:MAG: hypothetical protein ACLP7A_14210 [Desulfobaccales bacterium]
MSKLIDGLVARNMVLRQMDPGDRRRVTLAPTALGRTARQSALEATAARLAERLASLPSSGRRSGSRQRDAKMMEVWQSSEP